MSDPVLNGFAACPAPPYYAVIFTSQRRPGDDDYDATAERMVALARKQPGFLGVESTRDSDGLGITVSYWKSEAAIRSWRANLQHEAARQAGRARWYSHYELRVAKVERAYSWDESMGREDPMSSRSDR